LIQNPRGFCLGRRKRVQFPSNQNIITTEETITDQTTTEAER